MKYIALSLLILSACSFKKNPLSDQALEGHEELYSEPTAPKDIELPPNVKRIVIAATNDMEAEYSVQNFEIKDEHNEKPLSVEIGGEDVISQYFSILREQYKNVLLLDSGDLFSGNSRVKDVQKFYAFQNYDAITLGLGDFNLKLPSKMNSYTEFFKSFAKSSKTPLIISNLYDLKSARHVEWKGSSPYLLKEIDGIKVGIIGLIPDDIAKLTPVDNRVALFVENMLQSTLRQARLLKSLGADLIVVMTHQGLSCGREIAQERKLPLEKVNFDPKKEGVCDLSSPLGTYLERLPPNLVDVVIGGRNHEKVANYVQGTLVLSSFGKGKSFSYAEFFVNTKENLVLKDIAVVHQPVMFCHEFFKETSDCYFKDPSVDHEERIPASFLGKKINAKKTENKTTRQALPEVDFGKALSQLEADIAYIAPSSRSSQLVTLKIEGKLLIKMLEEDFNGKLAGNWFPSPFRMEKDYLKITLQGEAIDAQKDYTVLADLEGIQSLYNLKRHLLSSKTKSLMNKSWSSFSITDTVQTKMAAQLR
jgi:hypothetical protein